MGVPHPSPISGADYSAAELSLENDAVILLDQRLLPGEERYVRLEHSADVARAITDMVVRGAPAIGIAAAYGLALTAHAHRNRSAADMQSALRQAADHLVRARPTAVNLAWAVSQILAAGHQTADAVAEHARRIHREDVAACKAIGARGARLLPSSGTVLTHCNAGALATGGYGTALGVIRAAVAMGARIKVLACETRPYLQGARLTSWELSRDGIDVELCTDAMPASYFARGEIAAVVVGADRVARNGDVANKIGTYSHAVAAHFHGRPFYVAAPRSTLDPGCARGADIVIEERSSEEVVSIAGHRIAPLGVHARHPGFDVTPAHLVSRLVTETGDVPGPEAASLM